MDEFVIERGDIEMNAEVRIEVKHDDEEKALRCLDTAFIEAREHIRKGAGHP